MDGQFFSLKNVIFGNTLYLLLPSSLQAYSPRHTLKLAPEGTNVCFPEVQACNPNFCGALSSQDPELGYLMVIAVKVASNLYIPDQFLLVCKYEAQWSASTFLVLDHLCQEVIINALQKAPRLLVLCCAAFPPF